MKSFTFPRTLTLSPYIKHFKFTANFFTRKRLKYIKKSREPVTEINGEEETIRYSFDKQDSFISRKLHATSSFQLHNTCDLFIKDLFIPKPISTNF